MGDLKLYTENAALVLYDSPLSADGKYSGIVENGIAGAALAFGELVYFSAADSRWELAKADAEATVKPQLGMCVLAAAGDGSATKILLIGKIRADAKFPALTVGGPAFVSNATAGLIMATAPSTSAHYVRIVGRAKSADELLFNPSGEWLKLV